MKKCIIFAVAAMAFAACTNEQEEAINDSQIAARISAGVSTRAINDEWEADEIGVMVTGGNAAMGIYQNVKYVTDATGTGPATFKPNNAIDQIIFKGSDEATFAAYGPYKYSENYYELPNSNGIISNNTSAQQIRNAQKVYDYIYASGVKGSVNSPDVSFKFKHVMARLVINVKASTESGITTQDLYDADYFLSGLIHSGTFNVATGEAKADENTQVTDDWDLKSYSMEEKGTDYITFTAILFPQTLSSPLAFKMQGGGGIYPATFKPELKTGESFTINITVKKGELAMSGNTIDVWTVNVNSGQDVDAAKQ